MPPGPADPIGDLRRWSDAGAHWRVVGNASDHVTMELLTCDGGEVVQRWSSDDPALRAWLGGRRSSLE